MIIIKSELWRNADAKQTIQSPHNCQIGLFIIVVLEKIIYSLLIVSIADNCSTLYYSIYCCKEAILLYTIRNLYVFILIDNMFPKNDNIITF